MYIQSEQMHATLTVSKTDDFSEWAYVDYLILS